jgi:hypothetical protein
LLPEALQQTTTQGVANITKVQWVFWWEGFFTPTLAKRNKP